ncbi:histidine kinase, partial [Planoprotostelium fungivorum]
LITMIKTSANSLLALINDLLEFAKLKQGKMKLKYNDVDLRQFIENCIMSLGVLYDKGNLDLCYWVHKECPYIVRTDENRLRQVIFNILSNAVKFTPSGQITMIVRPTGPHTLEFDISDSGVGMTAEDLSQLFSRFFQSESHDMERRIGTGIGLSISKQLVQLMGGDITVTSQKGVGTTFKFTIDINPQEQPLGLDSSSSVRRTRSNSRPVTPRVQAGHHLFICLRNQHVAEFIHHAVNSDHKMEVKTFESMTELGDAARKAAGRVNIPCVTILIEQSQRHLLEFSELNLLCQAGILTQIIMVSPNSVVLDQHSELSENIPAMIPVEYTRRVFNVTRLCQLMNHMDRKAQVQAAASAVYTVPSITFQASPPIIFAKPKGKVPEKEPLTQRASEISSEEKNVAKTTSQERLLPIPDIVLQNQTNLLRNSSERKWSTESDAPTEKKDPRNLRILVVEDDKTNQKVIQLMMTRMGGIDLKIAENGEEGVKRFLEAHDSLQPYDCIFMDAQMPIMDGCKATAEIRRLEELRPELGHNHVTALTANALMDEKDQLFRTLVDDYMTKPVGYQTLLNKIQLLR